MNCPTCSGSGYVTHVTLSGNGETKNYSKCHQKGCTNTYKYYLFIKERYSNLPKNNVIHVDFKNRKKLELEKEEKH